MIFAMPQVTTLATRAADRAAMPVSVYARLMALATGTPAPDADEMDAAEQSLDCLNHISADRR
jgi:hypothetical protein